MIGGTEPERARRALPPSTPPPVPHAYGQLCGLLAAWPAHPEEFERRCERVTDWTALLVLIEQHGVLGVLSSPLLEGNVQLTPEVRARFEERGTVERVWNGRLNAALGEALAAFESAAVAVLPLKGPVLSERLHADPLARLSADLDLLVREADFDRARQVLESLGYQTEQGPTARYLRRYHHHLSLTLPRGPTVELHFHAFTGFGTTISAEALFAGASPYRTTRGQTCLVAAAENELVYLCAHAAGHAFLRLAWLYDIKMFIARHPQLQIDSVLARAHALGVGVAVACAFDVLCRRLGYDRSSVTAARPGLRLRAASGLLKKLETLPVFSARVKFYSLISQSLLCDRLSSSAWYLQHHCRRIVRRRLQRALPGIVPVEWSG